MNSVLYSKEFILRQVAIIAEIILGYSISKIYFYEAVCSETKDINNLEKILKLRFINAKISI